MNGERWPGLVELEADGLAIREHPRRVLCFWSAATMEQDRAAADEWRAGADARSDEAFERMAELFGKPSARPALAADLPMVEVLR